MRRWKKPPEPKRAKPVPQPANDRIRTTTACGTAIPSNEMSRADFQLRRATSCTLVSQALYNVPCGRTSGSPPPPGTGAYCGGTEYPPAGGVYGAAGGRPDMGAVGGAFGSCGMPGG